MNFNEIFTTKDTCDVDKVVRRGGLPTTPLVLIAGGTPCTGHTFYVSIEKQIVETFSLFSDAFNYMFQSYYVFNLAYPIGVIFTLELFQRYYFGINAKGSKSPKKTKLNQRLLKLVRRLVILDDKEEEDVDEDLPF